ncbi:MAG: DUF58 domain-containing protein [Bdellovibrionales bacterium]
MRERIYIIPNRFGLMYGSGVIVTLIAGTIYSNNLIYMLCFFLVSLFVVAMVQTNSNLRGLNFEKIQIPLIESQGSGSAVLWLKSKNREDHHQLKIRLIENETEHEFHAEKVSALTLTPIRFALHAKTRGVKKINKLHISTVFPFGLFYAWKVLPIEAYYRVYPEPMGTHALPSSTVLAEALIVDQGQTGDDYSQHVKYQTGHSQRHVDWKAVARGRPMLVKEFKDGLNTGYELDYSKINGDIEKRLSQLSLWVNICSVQQVPFSMKVGRKILPIDIGPYHKTRCLEYLAQYQGVDDVS